MMTKISDLPVHLVEEILHRVPLKCTRAVRSTCKEWDTLFKSRRFSKMHIDKIRAGESSMLVAALMDYNLYLMNVVLVVNEDPLIECKGKLTCLDNKEIKISQVLHCDGLLVCVLDDATKVVVWNPNWVQARSIEFGFSLRHNGRDMFSYSLGYEDKGSSCRTYKFLRFIDQCEDYADEDQFLWYEIYDFESSSWKTLDVTPHWLILSNQDGVSLKGNTYWPASPRNCAYEGLDNNIICFNFTSESFGPLLRLPFDADDGDEVTLSCVREEKLAVLFTHYGLAGPLEFEIWITTKIEAEKVSWSKFLSVVDPEFDPLFPSGCFFVDEEKKVAMGFEEEEEDFTTFNIVGEAGYLKRLELGERLGRDIKWRLKACSYVPSLVQIKQPAAGSKRKQQSELEKQRYDQKMERLVALKKRSMFC